MKKNIETIESDPVGQGDSQKLMGPEGSKDAIIEKEVDPEIKEGQETLEKNTQILSENLAQLEDLDTQEPKGGWSVEIQKKIEAIKDFIIEKPSLNVLLLPIGYAGGVIGNQIAENPIGIIAGVAGGVAVATFLKFKLYMDSKKSAEQHDKFAKSEEESLNK